MSANWSWPAARAPAITCSWVTPAGSVLLIAPSKIRLIALLMIFGPMTAKNTLTTARRMTSTTRGASGRRWPNRRRREPRKSLDFWGGRPIPIPNMPGPPGRRPPGPPGPPARLERRVARRGASRAWCRTCSGAGCRCRPSVARRSCHGLRLGQLRVDDLAVGLVRLQQLAVRADPDDRAVVHDDDLVGVQDRADSLGDDDHGRVAELALEGRPEARVGREVEGAEAVVEDVDRRRP